VQRMVIMVIRHIINFILGHIGLIEHASPYLDRIEKVLTDIIRKKAEKRRMKKKKKEQRELNKYTLPSIKYSFHPADRRSNRQIGR
jgi:hypothetical protein